jgi:D-lactate dehydrogenase
MRTLCFSTKPYDRSSFTSANLSAGHELTFITPGLSPETVALAAGYPAICLFVNDAADCTILERLASGGTRFIALRCAGFNNVDLPAATALGITVVRVPAYSPYATAEHAIALMLMLNRHLHRAYQRVREGNFSLDGLLGFDMHGKTVGIIGTGRIGAVACRIMIGFGCTVLASDPVINPAVVASGGRYVPLDELLAASDIVTLHAPLTPETKHLIDAPRIARLKTGVMLINTRRLVHVSMALRQCHWAPHAAAYHAYFWWRLEHLHLMMPGVRRSIPHNVRKSARSNVDLTQGVLVTYSCVHRMKMRPQL